MRLDDAVKSHDLRWRLLGAVLAVDFVNFVFWFRRSWPDIRTRLMGIWAYDRAYGWGETEHWGWVDD